MKHPLRVLIIEDSEDDAFLTTREIKKGGYDIYHKRVETRDELVEALEKNFWDIIISDHMMPHFSAIEGLEVLREKKLETPFIILSGAIGEETAVNAMKAGANDYIMKDNLHKLIPVVKRCLKDAEEKHRRAIAEKRLIESEEKNRLIVENASDAIMVIYGDEIKFVNGVTEKLFGYSSKDFLEKGIKVFDSEEQEYINNFYNDLMNGNLTNATKEIVYKRKDGKKLCLEINAVKMDWKGDLSMLAFVRDITARKESEEEIRKLSTALEQSPVAVEITGPDKKIEYINYKFSQLTGISKEEAIGKYPLFFKSDLSKEEYDNIWETVKNDKEWRGEFSFRNKEGKTLWESASISAIKNENNENSNFIIVIEDITARKQAEEEVKRINTKLDSLVKDQKSVIGQLDNVIKRDINDVFINMDFDYNINYLNEGALNFFEKKEYQKDAIKDLLLKSPFLKEHLKLLQSDNEIINYSDSFFIDGSEKFIVFSIIKEKTLWAENKETVTIIGKDITKQKDLENVLKIALKELTFKNKELQKEKEKAEELSKVKSTFISTVSHELRTPLNAIINFVNLLEKGFYDKDKTGKITRFNEQQKEKLKIVQDSAINLLNLINDILDLNKLQAGKMRLYYEDFLIKDLIDSVSRRVLDTYLKDKMDKVSYEVVYKNNPILHSDRKRVVQVISNLLSNSAKFTNKGKIIIIVDVVSDEVQIEVIDTGIGMKKEDLEIIFDEFRQIDGSETRSYEGTGLGLPIVKKIISLLGGKIHVSSEPDKGSKFSVFLPLNQETNVY